MFKKIAGAVGVLLLIVTISGFLKADQGDIWSMGCNASGCKVRINSSGTLVVTGLTNTGTFTNTGSVAISGNAVVTGQTSTLSASSTTLAATIPAAVGAIAWNTSQKRLCVSSGTTALTWVQTSTPTSTCFE